MHISCPRARISLWKFRKKWTGAGCRMSMSIRMRSGIRNRTPRGGQDASAPARPGELSQVADREQHGEHRRVLQLAALVGPGDQVGEIVGERLDGPVGVLVGGDL